MHSLRWQPASKPDQCSRNAPDPGEGAGGRDEHPSPGASLGRWPLGEDLRKVKGNQAVVAHEARDADALAEHGGEGVGVRVAQVHELL